MAIPNTKGSNKSNNAGKININLKKTEGVGGTRSLEVVPMYLQSECEKVINGATNSSIVLGRDRHGSVISGESAFGATQAAAIDIVVGRMSGLEIRELPKINNKIVDKDGNIVDVPQESGFLYVNSSFDHDSARLYLSEKADIDRYLGVFNTLIAASAKDVNRVIFPREAYAKSTAALISDHTRIVGRESVRLMTKYAGFNSRGGQTDPAGGIELIAGSIIDTGEYSLQPIVKGNNLIDALNKMLDFIEDIGKCLNNFIDEQRSFNDNYLKHKHTLEEFWPQFRTTAPLIMDRIEGNLINTEILTTVQREILQNIHEHRLHVFNNYLTDHGPQFINSKFNKVN